MILAVVSRFARVLPFHARKMVGPIIKQTETLILALFYLFRSFWPCGLCTWGRCPFDVRPHPHYWSFIFFATRLTYPHVRRLTMHHRDSVGSDIVIRPGAVNWMTAGRGITHSERTPPKERAAGQSMHGLQTWVALPKTHEMMEPSFVHHPESTLPVQQINGAEIRVLAGTAFGQSSPVDFPWGILYAAIDTAVTSEITFPGDAADERAIYLVAGSVSIDGQTFTEGKMIVLAEGKDVTAEFSSGTKGIICGGQTMDGKRFIDWNFVASDKSMIDQAKADWQTWIDSGYSTDRFGSLDEGEHIPLPE